MTPCHAPQCAEPPLGPPHPLGHLLCLAHVLEPPQLPAWWWGWRIATVAAAEAAAVPPPPALAVEAPDLIRSACYGLQGKCIVPGVLYPGGRYCLGHTPEHLRSSTENLRQPGNQSSLASVQPSMAAPDPELLAALGAVMNQIRGSIPVAELERHTDGPDVGPCQRCGSRLVRRYGSSAFPFCPSCPTGTS